MEITVVKEGEFTKGDVERIIDSLPALPGANYGARLDILAPSNKEGKEDE
jgi:hypothetical protein